MQGHATPSPTPDRILDVGLSFWAARTLLTGVALSLFTYLAQSAPQQFDEIADALLLGGALIIHESLIDDDRRENAFGLHMSLNMLIEAAEGFDFTGADCAAWMREAGFTSTTVTHLVGPDSMVVALK